MALFSRCIEKFPESAIWHNRLGMAFQERGDLEGAERELSASLKLDPDDGATLYDLGMVHARLGRDSDGAREIATGLKMLPHAPPDAYVVLAQLYDKDGKRAQSDATLDYAESLPGGIEPAELARAGIEMTHGDHAAAEKILRRITGRSPDDHDAWTALGAALFAQDRNDDALKAFYNAAALAPRDPRVHFYAARVLYKLGRNDEAFMQCRWAVTLDPDDVGARSLLSQIAGELNKNQRPD